MGAIGLLWNLKKYLQASENRDRWHNPCGVLILGVSRKVIKNLISPFFSNLRYFKQLRTLDFNEFVLKSVKNVSIGFSIKMQTIFSFEFLRWS